jgi:hypothetical protein
MIAEFMSKADSALGSAKLLLDAGDSDGATNRAWYAMFDAASAALAWAGAAATHDRHKTHSGLSLVEGSKSGPPHYVLAMGTIGHLARGNAVAAAGGGVMSSTKISRMELGNCDPVTVCLFSRSSLDEPFVFCRNLADWYCFFTSLLGQPCLSSANQREWVNGRVGANFTCVA